MQSIRETLKHTNHWDLYNCFFLMDDVERLRKFLVREHFFKMTLEIPGDIVEMGVFKGTGLAQLLKLREIYIPASNKKVLGFDLFTDDDGYVTNKNDKLLKEYMTGVKKNDLLEILNKIKLTNNIEQENSNLYELIEGDIEKTLPSFLEKNIGFRISLLIMDLDIEKPTEIALNLLYNRLVRGGIIVFDEYAEHEWSESNAVDKFLKLHPEIELKTLPWARTPTAYIIKK